MELLIPGLILVALMVYASTRIKKAAAQAYEAEVVEIDDFVLSKPEGFLNVVDPKPPYLFEAYSKEFGGGGNHRMATAVISRFEGVEADQVRSRIMKSSDRVVADRNEIIGERTYRVLETRNSSDSIELTNFYKVVERAGSTLELKISALSETTDEFRRNIELMLDSFILKPE